MRGMSFLVFYRPICGRRYLMLADLDRGNATTRIAHERCIVPHSRLAAGDLLPRSRDKSTGPPLRKILAEAIGGGAAGDRAPLGRGPGLVRRRALPFVQR